MTTEMIVESPVTVPPSVLVPTGEIEGVVVEAEGVTETPVAETPAVVEQGSEEVTQMVTMKKRRGRPPMSLDKRAKTQVKPGRAFWETADPMNMKTLLDHQFNGVVQPLIMKVLKQGFGIVQTYDHSGVTTKPREEVEALILSHGGRCVHSYESGASYVWKDTFMAVKFGGGRSGRLNFHTSDAEVYKYWSEFGDSWLKDPPPVVRRPQVNSFLNTPSGIQVMAVGELNDTLIEDNYPQEVVKDYRYICEQFTATEPAGRLALLEGVPGTGKTRLIRAMICELMDSANCILVAPNALPHLSGAEFLGALIREHHQGLPIILILEDADACLIKRDEDKASLDALTGLLNLSDGILGATLDIRIIATTNAKLEKLDDAVMRPGRLIRRVNLGPLPKEQAEAVFNRLTGRTQAFDDGATIATVYAAAAAMGDLERAAREAQAAADKAAFEAASEIEDEVAELE